MFRRVKTTALLFRRFFCSAHSFSVIETLMRKPINQRVLVQGWVQAVRKHKDVYFVDLIDGSSLGRLQIVIQPENDRFPAYGSSIKVIGSVVESTHKGQDIEIVVDSWEELGPCDDSYPFKYHQKYSSEYIRYYPHLRPRTRFFSSILRIRNHASMAVHKFFQDEGFCFVHTPIITHNDCEGAGEVFSVDVKGKLAEKLLNEDKDRESNLPANGTNEEQSADSNHKLEHFFGAPSYLTVSGQLHLEAMASALSRVYNFGPTFRAESSKTRLHASEFQMIEAEIAFIDAVEDLLLIVEKCIKNIVKSLFESCPEEIKFVTKDVHNHDRYINNLLLKEYVRMTYKEAIHILKKKKTKIPIEPGEDISAEHKQALVKHCGNLPVFVTSFPAAMKPFYMKTFEDCASCFDLFAAHGGEVCGGSLREDDETKLREKHSFQSSNHLSWYLDLRRYGSVPHGGFGIGFDRLLLSILGISNIRDIIPFPRRKNDCRC